MLLLATNTRGTIFTSEYRTGIQKFGGTYRITVTPGYICYKAEMVIREQHVLKGGWASVCGVGGSMCVRVGGGGGGEGGLCVGMCMLVGGSLCLSVCVYPKTS